MGDPIKIFTKKQNDLQQKAGIEKPSEDRYFFVENSVFEEDLSTFEKLTLIALYRYMGPEQHRFPNYTELLKDLGCSQEQFIEALKSLKVYFESKQQAMSAAEE